MYAMLYSDIPGINEGHARRIAAAIVAALVFFLACPTAVQAQSGRGDMNGVVLGASDTQGLPGALVELLGDPFNPRLAKIRLTATTDGYGFYAFKAVPYGDYTFRASAPGFADYSVPVYIPSDAVTTIHIRLKSTPLALSVQGGDPVAYQSKNGERIIAKYYTLSDKSLEFVRLTLPGGREYTLPRVSAASGVRYTDDRELVWWVKGDKATAEIRDIDGKWAVLYADCVVIKK